MQTEANRSNHLLMLFSWWHNNSIINDYQGQLQMLKGDDFCMLAQWMESFFGKMRANKIKDFELAQEVDWHPKYLSAVLNGRRNPKGAQEKLDAALDRIIERKSNA